MPVKKGKSKKTMDKNFKELGKGATYKHTASKFGKKAADKQRVAIVMKAAGKSMPKKGGKEPSMADYAKMRGRAR